MPTLTRFALSEPTYNYGWYGDQLIFHLYTGATYNSFLQHCNTTQREAVALFLAHLIETRSNLKERITDDDDFLRAHAIWANA